MASREQETGREYDLASGFQTLIRSTDGISDAIDQLRHTIVASMDQQAHYNPDPQMAAAARGVRDAGRTGTPTAGYTTGQGLHEERQSYEQMQYNAAQRFFTRAQPRRGQFAPGGPFGGSVEHGWADFLGTRSQASTGGPGGPPGNNSGSGGGGGGGGGGTGRPGGGAAAAGGGGGGGATPPPGPGGVSMDAPQGGGLVNALLGHVPGYGTYQKVMQEIHDQQTKTDYYRNVTGSGYDDALRERMGEEGFAHNPLNRRWFDEEEARAAYKGVVRLGYNQYSDRTGPVGGATQTEALDFLTEAKKSRGQDLSESLGQLQAASKSASIDLDSLNAALDGVSEAAGKAGSNTQMVRQQFLNMMTQGINRGQGGGAVGFAQTIASTNASYGRDYAATVDSSGLYSPQMEYRAAGMSGMTQMELRNIERTDPVRAQQIFGKIADQTIESAGVTPEMKQWIKNEVRNSGGVQALRTDDGQLADQIAQSFLSTFEDQFPSADAFTQVLSSLSGQSFPNDLMAARWLIENVAGNSMADNARRTQAQTQRTDLHGRTKGGERVEGMDKTLSGFAEKTKSGGIFGIWEGNSPAARHYIERAKKSGQRDPVIEQLLKSEEMKGGGALGTQVQVHTADGPRVVSLDEALQKFPNQVSAGAVKFMSGKAAGKSVADVTGGRVDSTRDWLKEAQKTTKAGESLKEWKKSHSEEWRHLVKGVKMPSASGGTVQIALTPDAARLVKAMNLAGDIGNAASANVPPRPNFTATRAG